MRARSVTWIPKWLNETAACVVIITPPPSACLPRPRSARALVLLHVADHTTAPWPHAHGERSGCPVIFRPFAVEYTSRQTRPGRFPRRTRLREGRQDSHAARREERIAWTTRPRPPAAPRSPVP